jgi:hypothetical protein
MDTPKTYLKFICLFPTFTKGEQLRLLTLMVSPSEVHRALGIVRAERYNARIAELEAPDND